MPISVKGRDGGREKSQGGWEKRKRGIRLITNGKKLQSLPDSSPLGHGSIASSQLRWQSICRGIPKASIDLQGERQRRQSICRVRRPHSIWGVAQAERGMAAAGRSGGAAAKGEREDERRRRCGAGTRRLDAEKTCRVQVRRR